MVVERTQTELSRLIYTGRLFCFLKGKDSTNQQDQEAFPLFEETLSIQSLISLLLIFILFSK